MQPTSHTVAVPLTVALVRVLMRFCFLFVCLFLPRNCNRSSSCIKHRRPRTPLENTTQHSSKPAMCDRNAASYVSLQQLASDQLIALASQASERQLSRLHGDVRVTPWPPVNTPQNTEAGATESRHVASPRPSPLTG